MRRFFPLLIILLLVHCGPKRTASTSVVDVIYPADGLFATNYKYLFFGKIGYRDRTFQEDTLVYPPIEGLIHKSAFVMCPTDTCVAERTVLALHCPPVEPLLRWMADTVCAFVDQCPIGGGLLKYNEKSIDVPKKYCNSAEAICDYYIDRLQHSYDGWHCTGEGDSDIINEQAGLLLADSWSVANLCTFYRLDWYDWMSSGNNVRESWWTVDATTGRLLTIDDMVLPEMKDSLASLMMPRLVNGKDNFITQQYHFKQDEYPDILQQANGCALIPEGLVLFFYPYTIGFGSDGQYEAVIPYDELEGILKGPLSMVLVPSHEEVVANENTRYGPDPNIDLFGTKLTGSPKHIIQEINKGGYIQIELGPQGFLEVMEDRFWCRVLIDGIPFAINVFYGKDVEAELIKEVIFVTNNPDESIMVSLQKSLTRYYGKPAFDDGEDGGCTWFPNGHFMKARHLHSLDEGGWTFYITRNKLNY